MYDTSRNDNTKVAHTARELRNEISEATQTLLAMYAPKAAYALTSVLDNPDALNARHVISAAKEILDMTGMIKKERVEVTGSAGGFLFYRLRHQIMARSETDVPKQELDLDTTVENLKITNQKYVYHPDPNKLRTPDGQIVYFVVA